uniref:Uncharacterized protein n=1 Tax=Leptocylindrus danicus TaxID=163516 RepID=A0A7S2L4T3_9STRA|mmetsp:Transcript_30995/g.45388  ORF Transcript_30995/g.45388 Transcript_30995/m.45388 type:complete len:265 (+) Transcript_30995:608-1402(+)|eukprot:CAMPEP_0116020260 /NCGR_PEP_ID=MMETSP0321-20121206/9697_1 /TAXON_ID=163516 /ORGANISM="Leptocylindrus danicus var. danicus, Strain B650" /LENGTH=264 /DNA_ID=CAMNT_0003490929 /DNA_START=671 /DNA_END=1465 /DNA_ORIENTATION=+
MTSTNRYNPNHPDADWSGYVRPRESRKHPEITPPAMKAQISSHSTGFVPGDDAVTSEWSKPGRRIINKSSFAGTSTLSLIGGAIPERDPDSLSSCRWESEAQASTRHKKTEIDQLTGTGRSMHVRTKKRATPAFEQMRAYNEEIAQKLRSENPYLYYSNNENCDKAKMPRRKGNSNIDLVGFRAHKGGAVKGLLSDIGKEIAQNIYQNNTHVAPAPYATDGNLPTDPYLSADGQRRKDLLLENFSSVTPGYTGKRTLRNQKLLN